MLKFPVKKTKPSIFIPNCYLTWSELEALKGLSDLSFRVYVVLRSHMEHDCHLGNHRSLSMSLFRTILQTSGGQGKRAKRPSTGQIQFCFDKLREHGLLNLSRYNPKDKDKMFLFFPIAEPYSLDRPHEV